MLTHGTAKQTALLTVHCAHIAGHILAIDDLPALIESSSALGLGYAFPDQLSRATVFERRIARIDGGLGEAEEALAGLGRWKGCG